MKRYLILVLLIAAAAASNKSNLTLAATHIVEVEDLKLSKMQAQDYAGSPPLTRYQRVVAEIR